MSLEIKSTKHHTEPSERGRCDADCWGMSELAVMDATDVSNRRHPRQVPWIRLCRQCAAALAIQLVAFLEEP